MKLASSLLCLAGSLSCLAGTLTVVNTGDSGAGSLRQAIQDANATPGPNVIAFNIPGTGVQTISPFHQLPVITNAVNIDGTTQPGYAGSPLIVLSGSSVFAPASGLVIASGGTTVRALTIRNFKYNPRVSHGIVLAGSGGNLVAGCYIGTDATGTAQQFNSGEGIWISNSVNNVIGGPAPADRNLISGNVDNGILISGSGSTGNQVVGNYIGLDIYGTNAIANSNNGILISNAPNNLIGGITTGARNVISGQSFNHGLVITGTGATGNLVEGNFIGTTAVGMAAAIISPNYDGISVNNAPSNTIGGTLSGARNIISGNYIGISLIGSNTTDNIIQGNFIGTDVSGYNRIQNYQGIAAEPLNGGSGAGSNTIGGLAPGARNVISGNKSYGVFLNFSAGNVVQGNYIGPDSSGRFALGNGISGAGGGISVAGSGNLIGGTTPGSGNVISGNPSDGLDIAVASQTDFSGNNLVQGNLIGVAADGVSPLGNGLVGIGGRGISVLGANSNLIGGSVAGSGNVIAYNGLDGVWLAGAFGAFGTPGTGNLVTGNTIYSNGFGALSLGGAAAGVTLLGANEVSSNSIYANVYLGIDRKGDGPTPNTPQGHSNFPVLTSVRKGSTDINGILNADPDCLYQIEFYENFENDFAATLFGFQSRVWLGSIVVTPGPFQATLAPTVDYGKSITAIATPLCEPKETSEVSQSFYFTALPGTNPPTVAFKMIQLQAEADVSSSEGRNMGVLGAMTPEGPWELLQVLPAMQTKVTLDSLADFLQQFYRIEFIGLLSNLKVLMVNPDGSPMQSGMVRVGRLEHPITTGADGTIQHDGFPAGRVSVGVQQQTVVSNGVSAATYTNRLDFQINVLAPFFVQLIKAALNVATNVPPACGCTPWCGIMSGLVDGSQKVVAGGGANGSCTETPNVQITGPGGINLSVPPGQRRLVFNPAANGTWTVTTTVCGQSKTCQLTVP